MNRTLRHTATHAWGDSPAAVDVAPNSVPADVTGNRLAGSVTLSTWRQAASGQWRSAAKWSANAAPGSGTDVLIAAVSKHAPASYTVTISGQAAAHAVTLNAAGAVLNDTGTLALGGALTIAAGTLALPHGSITGGTLVFANGGAIQIGKATLTNTLIDGPLSLTSAASTLILAGKSGFAGGAGGPGRAIISGSQDVLQFAGAPYPSSGSFTLSAVALSLGSADLTLATAAELLVGPAISRFMLGSDARFDAINQTARIVMQGSAHGAPTVFVNAGAMTASAGGTLDIQAAQFANQGTLAISNGSDVVIESTAFANQGTLLVANGSGVVIEGNSMTNAGAIEITTGGNLELWAAVSSAFIAGINNHGGTLVLDGGLTTTSALSIGAGNTVVAGRGSVFSSGISGQGTLRLGGGVLFLAGASLNITTVSQSVVSDLVDGGATVLVGPATDWQLGSGTLAGATSGNFSTSTSIISNLGTLDIGGTLSITAQLVNTGTVNIAAGATLTLTQSTVLGGVYGGLGTLSLYGPSIAQEIGNNVPPATYTITSSGTQAVANVIDNGGSFTLSANTTYTVGLGENFIWANEFFNGSGTLAGGVGSEFINAGHFILTGSDWLQIGMKFVNTGVIDAAAGSGLYPNFVTGDFTNTGTFNAAGSVYFQGGISGTGRIAMADHSFIGISGVVGIGQNLDFMPGSATLAFSNPGAMSGTIGGFASGDIISLNGIDATGLTFTNGVLGILAGASTVATLNFAGNYSAGDFAFAVSQPALTGVPVSTVISFM